MSSDSLFSEKTQWISTEKQSKRVLMKPSLYIIKENEGLHRSFRTKFLWRKKLRVAKIWKNVFSIFFPKYKSMDQNHSSKSSISKKLSQKASTKNKHNQFGYYHTLTKCSIDSLVALWAFHHRTVSMVSWKKNYIS